MPNPIYFDHNATTPIDPAVAFAMEPYVRELYGNPSSVEHEHGNRAARAVEAAREQIAKAINARPNEIVFTGSCTEADNLAILGVARAHPAKRHLVTTAVEHPGIIGPARALEREGWLVTYLPVDEFGRIEIAALMDAVTDETALVSVMAANNEVGTTQPIGEIGSFCASRGILFHSDLAQVTGSGDIDVSRDNIHLASLSAHKAYGPKGIGVLYVRSRSPRAKISPIQFGGGQERGLRPGTLNVPAIVGMGEALHIAGRQGKSEAKRVRLMCESFRDSFLAAVPDAKLNGHPVERLCNNLSFSVAGVEPLALIRRLRDQMSFSASSACSTDKIETSPVLKAMFGEGARARNSFRLAPGRRTTTEEMDAALRLMTHEIRSLRDIARTAA